MYKIVSGSDQNLTDVRMFIEVINKLDQNEISEERFLFDKKNDLIVTRAPGRLDVMGGFADYSGSLVLQLPTKEAALSAIQLTADRKIKVVSLSAENTKRCSYFEMPLDDFLSSGKPIDYGAAQKYFQGDPARQWAAYVAGAFLILMKEKKIEFKQGAKILIHSDVPEGKGVSSSAALEVAAMQSIAAAFKIKIEVRELALLCQKVENLIVGAPCGVMDQMTAVCGKKNRLMSLLCQPAELKESLEIPDEIAFWGIDSGVRHSVAGADYGSVRVGAFMGYRILSEIAKFKVTNNKEKGRVEIRDSVWNGYLSNISPSLFEQNFAKNIPHQIKGEEFLRKYGGITDSVTQIEPSRSYAVRMPTRHPIYENFRVHSFAELLQRPVTNQKLNLLGELMYQSHFSYSACGLGSEGTDLLVNLVRDVGVKQGLFGAKISGGGSGGTVVVMGRKNAYEFIEKIAEEYKSQTGIEPYIFKDSSVGANEFGHLILKKEAL